MALFGTSGIRGRYPTEIHEDLFLQVGTALATLFDQVALGRDVRMTGVPLQQALAAGLTAGGAQAFDCGVVATPTIAHVAAHFDGGAIVTASHNPPEDNGLKLWSPSGMAFDEIGRSQVEEAMGGDRISLDWDEVGETLPYPTALREHREKILGAVESADLKVAVDCGNGATSRLTPRVLREQGCEVRALNAHPDGTFPGRGPEPTEAALEGLGKTVRRAECGVGLGHDGDGDRMVALDDRGQLVAGEKLLILFARALKARTVAVPVDASMVLEDLLGADRVMRTKVGDVYVAEALLHEGADFGGEASGTWIFPDFALCPDGIYAATYLCAALTEDPLEAWVGDVPAYPIRRGAVTYDRAQGLPALDDALATVEAAEVSRVDGWRFDFGDGWGLVRPSGTEPKIRLTAEAREEARAREIYGSLHSTVSKAVG